MSLSSRRFRDPSKFIDPSKSASDSVGSVTSITAGTGLDGGTITTSGTIDMADTAVTPDSYTNSNITVDQQGRITAASSGSVTTVISTGVTTISIGLGTLDSDSLMTKEYVGDAEWRDVAYNNVWTFMTSGALIGGVYTFSFTITLPDGYDDGSENYGFGSSCRVTNGSTYISNYPFISISGSTITVAIGMDVPSTGTSSMSFQLTGRYKIAP